MARSVILVMSIAAGLLAGTALAAEPATRATRASAEQAVQDARQRLKQDILATEIEPGKTVRSLLQKQGMEGELDRELEAAKPVGGARWIDDQNCQVRVELPGDRVAEIIGRAARDADQRKASEVVGRMTFVSVGRSAPQDGKARPGPERKLIPQQPPDWVNKMLSAEAWSGGGITPLMSAQAAEADARKLLAQQVGALTLAYSTNVQTAGETEPAIADAAKRALATARVRKTDYGADGSAKVRVEMNLRTLWDELNR